MKTNNNIINNYLLTVEKNAPILVSDLYVQFPKIKETNVRQIVKRLVDRGELLRAMEGVYYKPRENSILKNPVLSSGKVIEAKYLKTNEEVYGYVSGLGFSNALNLTTQIPSRELIVSNNVKGQKRLIKNNLYAIYVAEPRIQVNNTNYKLLQVMDLFSNFNSLSEKSLIEAKPALLNYLKENKMSKEEIDLCIESYPIKAQLKMYKSGIYNEISK